MSRLILYAIVGVIVAFFIYEATTLSGTIDKTKTAITHVEIEK